MLFYLNNSARPYTGIPSLTRILQIVRQIIYANGGFYYKRYFGTFFKHCNEYKFRYEVMMKKINIKKMFLMMSLVVVVVCMCVKVRGQHEGSSCIFLPYKSQGLSLGVRAWWKVSLPAESF